VSIDGIKLEKQPENSLSRHSASILPRYIFGDLQKLR
jgi:hypothetical protein